jgi:hypothetical protein
MTKYFFWENWDLQNKILYSFLFILFVATLIYFLSAYLHGASHVITWQLESDIKSVKTIFDTYQVGLYEFPIEVENYLILQNFVPSQLMIKEWPAIPMLALFALSMVTLITIVTTLKRVWYVIAMALLALALVGLKFEFLQIFGRYDKTGLFTAFFLYFSISYYFQFFRRSSSFVSRWVTFLIATLMFGVFIFWFSAVPNKFLHLVNYGLYVPLTLSVIFIFMVGHETVAAFLYVTTRGGFKSKRSNLIHFLIISLIYLINVVIVYLRNTKAVDLGIYTINSYWLLVIATVLGIWGYKRREPTYLKMYPFKVSGAFLYISLATITFASITYLLQNGNDSLLETMEDAIVFSQIGHGSMFIIYVIANFYTLLYKNIQVSKIVYKPPRMPFFISRFAGLIVIMGLFLRGNLIPFYQSIAGYNTGIGDIYYNNGEHLSAQAYYNIANDYSATSHRANYALASIAEQNNKPSDALMHLLQSVIKNPTPFAYAKIARQYELRDRFFDALFTLRDANREFPKSGPLMNNLGLLYSKTEITDSTFYFLENAKELSISNQVSNSNSIAIASHREMPLTEEILSELLAESTHLPTINNQMILAKQYAQDYVGTVEVNFEADMDEQTEQLIYNYNKLLIGPTSEDTTHWRNKYIYYDHTGDPWMGEQLETAFAFSAFSNGAVTRAFNTFNYLLNLQNSRRTFYGKILGRLALKKDAPESASDYLRAVYNQGDVSIAPELGLSLMAMDDSSQASSVFNAILSNPDTTYHALAREMLEIIQEDDPRSLLEKEPHQMYHFIKFRFDDFDDSVMEGLILSLEHQNYQQLAYLDLLKRSLDMNDKGKASQLIHSLRNTEFENPILKRKFNNAMIRFLVSNQDFGTLKPFVENFTNSDAHSNLLFLANSLVNGFDGNRTESLKSLEFIAFQDPFIEITALEPARQFNQNKTNPQLTYDILLNAVNVNSYSRNLNEAYILQCLKLGLENYAEDALTDYKLKVSDEIFDAFLIQYNAAKKEYSEIDESWR